MAKTKISEWSTTPASNTDIDGINIAEGCAPSGINDAIRDLMAQVRSWQSGASGDPFNGPMNGTIGATTAYSGAFTTVSATGVITSTLATGTAPLTIASTTKVANLNADLLDGADWASPAALGSTTPAAVSATTLSASSTVSGTGFSNYLASPPAIGGTNAAAGSFTTLTTSSTVTLNGGTANGVTYLNGSKVLTSGSALTFDGTNFIVGGGGGLSRFNVSNNGSGGFELNPDGTNSGPALIAYNRGGSSYLQMTANALNYVWQNSGTETMRLTSTGLGIGTSSPAYKLDVQSTGSTTAQFYRTDGVYSLQLKGTGTTSTGALGMSTNDMVFLTNGSERMRLDSAGNFLVGVTSAFSSGKVCVQVANGSTTNGITIQDNASSGFGYIAFANGSGSTIGSITRITTTNAVAYNTTSDYRLKTVTGAVTGQGARIDALNPIDYQWKEGGQQARGFLAHEFQTVYPNSVTGEKDAVDADGNPVYQAMQASTAEVIADLVAEIKSLRQRVAQLETN